MTIVNDMTSAITSAIATISGTTSFKWVQFHN